MVSNPYKWMITTHTKDQFTAASFQDSPTLQDVLKRRNDVVRIDFIPDDPRFPKVGFYLPPGAEIVFGVYHWRRYVERFVPGDRTHPDPRRWTALAGWTDNTAHRRFVVGVDLATGALEMQGE